MDYHQDYSPLGIEHVLVFPEKFNAIFLVDWTGVKQNITTPFLCPRLLLPMALLHMTAVTHFILNRLSFLVMLRQ